MLTLRYPNNVSNTGTLINCLPPELLSDIFWLIIQDDYTFGYTARNPITRTIMLCSVCSNWRSVILSRPLFWSSFPVRDDEHSGRLVRLCLERSRDSLIDIVAYASYTRNTRSSNDSSSFGGDGYWQGEPQLITHAPRIRSIVLLGRTEGCIQSFLDWILGGRELGSIVKLSIIQTERYRGSADALDHRDNSAQENFIRLSDKLHTFHLENAFLSEIWKGWEGCSFSQLRELVLNDYCLGYEQVLEIITTSTNLQLLEFFNRVKSTTDFTSLKPVLWPGQGSKVLRLHKLSSYYVRLGMKWAIPRVWVTEISISMNNYEPLHTLPNFSTIVALSLEEVEYYPSYARDSSMGNPLKDLSNLHTLSLKNFSLSDETPFSMTRPQDVADNEFAQLSVLRLHSVRIDDYAGFQTIVASHPIRRLEIWHDELKSGKSKNRKQAETSHKLTAGSPLYLWLRGNVADLYIVPS